MNYRHMRGATGRDAVAVNATGIRHTFYELLAGDEIVPNLPRFCHVDLLPGLSMNRATFIGTTLALD